MERVRMVGNIELVHEQGMKMYRFLNKETEEFSSWFSPEEAEELKKMNDDDFFATAEKSIQDSNKEE